MNAIDDEVMRRIRHDLIDSYDEELEMDLESRRRWEDYTRAKEIMLARTHIPQAPWWVVHADDKKKARLNCIYHLLQQMPYQETERLPVVLPERVRHEDYVRQPVPQDIVVPEVY